MFHESFCDTQTKCFKVFITLQKRRYGGHVRAILQREQNIEIIAEKRTKRGEYSKDEAASSFNNCGCKMKR